MLQDTLYQQRPSRQDTFARDVQAMIDLVRSRPDQRAADYPGIVDLQELAGLAATQANTRLWEDAAGKVIGFAIVDPQYNSITFEISSMVHRAALGAEMLAWGAAQLGQQDATVIRTNCRDDNPERIALLQQQGFVTEAGSVLHFQRLLTEPLPSPHLPDGFVVRPVAGEQEVAQLVELQRAAFGTQNMTVAYRLAMMRVPEYDSSLDLIVIAPHGQWAAFCMGNISQQENQPRSQMIGWLDPIGTRPVFRRQGLARALLLTNLQHFQARGLVLAGTTTSSENLAMRRTAESVGFRVTATTSWYQKRLR